MGGLLDGATVSAAMKALLLQDADDFTWVAATVHAQSAASYQLATERSVMAIGGFNGTVNSPTLAQFQADVAAGRIHYFIASGGDGRTSGSGSQDSAAQIRAWVQDTFTAQTVDGTVVYDLTDGK